MAINDIVLATNNPHKLQEIKLFFLNTPYTIISQSELGIWEVDETGTDLLANAVIKANHAANYTDLPVLADDSGLEIDALNGAPGVFSSRYAGANATTEANIAKVLDDLKNIPVEQRTARFRCVLVYLAAKGEPPLICEGTWEGSILFTPQDTSGFGYEPIFWVHTHNCSAAKLQRDVKNVISHRGVALKKLLAFLSNY